jgi:N-acetylglucosamine malate deacetylase 1
MTRRILAISAHPDDETLGCGGTLLKHVDQGDEIHWLIVTAPWEPLFDSQWLARRQDEIKAVAEAYGMTSTTCLDLPVTKIDALALGEIIEPMRGAIETIDPDIVYLVHRGDVHSDHRVTFDAAIAVLKPFRAGARTSIYSYECTSSTNMSPPFPQNAFIPQAYGDISGYLERKLEILSLYETEIFEPPHPRSLNAARALAQYRGASVSVDAAEAFCVIRELW